MTTSSRTYGQNCGLARVLDLVGERWSLLVVRELARGRKRFVDLSRALPGIGTSMLASRLKHLEAGGVLERAPTDAGADGYGLTARGEALARALGDLMLWGLELPDLVQRGDQTRAAWLAMNLQAALRDADPPAPAGTYAFEVGDERFWLHVGGDVTLRDGPPPFPPDATLTAPLPAFVALVTGAGQLQALRAAGATIDGDRARLATLLERAALPAPRLAAAGSDERLALLGEA